MNVAAIILAAGRSTRMNGKNKLLLDANGKAIISTVTDSVISAGYKPILVVTGFETEKIRHAVESRTINVVSNSQWQDGIVGSIKVGIASLPPETEGAAIVLGDMPLLSVQTLQLLRQQFIKQGGNKIVYPTYGGQQGNPVIFPNRFFPHILMMPGDTGCKPVLKEHPDESVAVDVGSDEVVVDCDTEQDHHRIVTRLRNRKLATAD